MSISRMENNKMTSLAVLLEINTMNILLSTVVVLVFGVGDVTSQTDLTVSTCWSTEVTFNVLNGVSGGIVLIEGTDDPVGCAPTLAGDASEEFTMHFGACNVSPTESASGTIIDFVIIVQELSVINTITDKRFKVECTFNDGTSTTTVTLKTSLTDPISYQERVFTNTPEPQLILYFTSNDTQTPTPAGNAAVPFGEELTLVINLKNDIPNYGIIAEECVIAAEAEAGTDTTADVALLDTDTRCSLMETIFPSFTYSTYTFTDSNGDSHDGTKLESDFKAFTPTLYTLRPSQQHIIVKIRCIVAVCFQDGSCDPAPTCPAVTRRKRQASQPTNSTYVHELQDSFRVMFGDEQSGNDVTTVHMGENDICLDQVSFYGMLLSLLSLLIAAWAILFCFCVYARRQRRRKQSKTPSRTTLVDSLSSKHTTLTPVGSNTLVQSVNTVPLCLPRYFPAAPGSFNDRSASA